MKRLIFLGLFLLTAAVAPAQQGPQEPPTGVKVVSVLHEDGSRTDTQTDYDSLTAESKTYNASKKLTQRVAYTTNEMGKPLEGAVYNAKDQLVGRVSFTYDEHTGRMQEQLDFTPNGALLQRQVFHYGPDGRVTYADTYDGKGNLVTPSTGKSQKTRPRPPVRR